MINNTKRFSFSLASALSLSLLLPSVHAGRSSSDYRLDLARYKQLREGERYQIELADKQYDAGQWDASINEFNKFIKLYPQSEACSYALFMVGRANENKKYPNEGIKQYLRVLDFYADTSEAPYALFRIAQCHRASGDEKEERQFYLKIIKEDKYKEHVLVSEVLWKLSELAGRETPPRTDKVAEYRKRIIVDFEKCRLYNSAVDWMARYYATTVDDPVAAREMILRYPGYIRESAELWIADRYLEKANAHRGQPEDDKFRKKARDIWTDFPVKFPKATRYAKNCHLQLARSYRDEGEPKKALKLYAEYLNKWPNDDGPRIDIARYLEDLSKWNDARIEYLKLSDKLRGQWEVAYSYHRQGKADPAIEAYQKVIDSDFVRYAYAMYQMAEVYYHQKHEYDKALKLFMESNYSPPTHLFRVSSCHCAMKRHKAAVTQYAEIVSFFKKSAPQAYLRMGDCYLHHMKMKREAVGVYKIVLDQFPKTGEASQAHLRLENLGVVVTGGGVKK